MPETAAAQRARECFPRGLIQPPGGFRFSADALLLAAFVLRGLLPGKSGRTLLDLGCGCGIVGLACLLGEEDLAAQGVDIDPDCVAAARANAAMLGLKSRFGAEVVDLAPGPDRARIPPGGYTVVAANMPYRDPGSGRLPNSAARARALFAGPGTMPSFLAAAKAALDPEGTLALIYPLDGRERLLNALREHGFTPVSARAVRAARESAARVLVRAAHAETVAARALPDEPELTLHTPPGPDGTRGITAEALEFCPWLGPAYTKALLPSVRVRKAFSSGRAP